MLGSRREVLYLVGRRHHFETTTNDNDAEVPWPMERSSKATNSRRLEAQ